MIPRLLSLLVMLGCTSGRSTRPEPDPSAAPEPEDREAVAVCERLATVTVHVQNQGSADVEITFGPYRPARAAPGFSRTTYAVPRSHLQSAIRLRIARGGLQVGGPARIPTEPVACNDATLVIAGDLRSSAFYGGLVAARLPRR
jgi:hypothetical protein